MNVHDIAGRPGSFLQAGLLLLVFSGCVTEISGVGSGASGGTGGSTSGVSASGPASATSSSSAATGSSSAATGSSSAATGSSSSGVPPVDPNDLLTAVGQCMSKVGFLDFELVQLANLPTDGNCTCATCHAAAEADLNGGQFVLDPSADVTFAAARQLPGLLNFVELDPTGQKVVESHGIFSKQDRDGACSCQTALGLKVNGVINVNNPAYCHPDYSVPYDLDDRLDSFVETAIVRSMALVCNADNTK